MLWLAITDLVSLLFGACGTVLLALSIGEPTGGRAADGVLEMHGREYPIAYVLSYRKWRWGLLLVGLAFAVQFPRVIVELVRALQL